MASQNVAFDVIITLVFVFVSFQLLLPVNSFIPFDRRTSSLFGAVLCMIIYYFSPVSAGDNPGSAVDFSVLIILTSVMIINFVILKQPWLARQVTKMQNMIRSDVDTGFYLVSIVSLVASPVILNDGLCLMLVAPVLDAFILSPSSADIEEANDMDLTTHEKPSFASSDPFFFMLTIACSANIGSTTTFAGNPQNIIVAQYLSKYMSGGVFFALTFLPAMISWLLTITLINRLRKRGAADENNNDNHSGRNSDSSGIELLSQQTDISPSRHSPVSSSLNLFINNNTNSSNDSHKMDDGENALDENGVQLQSGAGSPPWLDAVDDENQHKSNIKNANSAKNVFYGLLTDPEPLTLSEPLSTSMPTPNNDNYTQNIDYAVVEPLAGIYFVIPAILLLIVLEFIGVIPLTGLFGTVSLGLVVVLLLWYYGQVVFRYYCCSTNSRNNSINLVNNNDIISNSNGSKNGSENSHEETNRDTLPLLTTPTQARALIISHALDPLYLELDYNLLIIFIGLFIVSGAFLKTGLPKEIWSLCAGSKPFQTATSIIVLSIYIIIASQLVGNVPVVFLAKEEVQLLEQRAQIFGWLILSFVSTIAGNLTLVGSAANIIVVEKAARHTKRPVMITAWAHFAICGGVTVVSIVLGVIVLYIETRLFI